MSSFYWSDTELDYLCMSNEDERILGFFRTFILPLLARIRRPINWLEVGPGPGTKTVQIFQTLTSDRNSRLESLRLLEPSPKWRAYLRKIQKPLFRSNKKTSVSLEGSKFERYTRREMIEPTESMPNFITFFHVLYEKTLIDEVICYLRHRASQAKPLVASIIVESEESDFFQLRKSLECVGCRLPFAAAPEIRRALEESGLPVKITTVNRQYCMIPGDRFNGEWLLPFLLGCSRSSVRRLSQAARHEAHLCIRDYIIARSKRRFRVPDLAFIVTIA